MAMILTVINQKGGVGKTTVAVNLSSFMSEYFQKILLLDFDPQSDASVWLCKDYGDSVGQLNAQHQRPKIEDILQFGLKNDLDDSAVKQELKALSLAAVSGITPAVITTSLNLDRIDREMTGIGERKAAAKLIETIKIISEDYDLVLIDTAPYISNLHYIVVSASDYILIPITLDATAIGGGGNVINLILSDVRKYYNNPDVSVIGVLINNYEKVSNISKAMEDMALEVFGDLIFKTRIKSAVKLRELPILNSTLDKVYPKLPLSQDFKDLALEIFSRMQT
ncbi:ParA family protein [Candidatus Magnetomonas plexicatena]|uniref:ParA family protein n=1 Tax=Candidatus Magnetomonas plexicatena TaxID=2552947 RepID=UPI001C764415|nr:ParA family protein [Nitrospirales bacterium LBB_01]